MLFVPCCLRPPASPHRVGVRWSSRGALARCGHAEQSHASTRHAHAVRLSLLAQDMRKEFRRISGCNASGDKASGRRKAKDKRRAPAASVPTDDAEWAARQDHMALISALPDDLLLPHVPSDARLVPVPTAEARRDKQHAV